jgi:hypothetical protein
MSFVVCDLFDCFFREELILAQSSINKLRKRLPTFEGITQAYVTLVSKIDSPLDLSLPRGLNICPDYAET